MKRHVHLVEPVFVMLGAPIGSLPHGRHIARLETSHPLAPTGVPNFAFRGLMPSPVSI